jgi:hypothetical protein
MLTVLTVFPCACAGKTSKTEMQAFNIAKKVSPIRVQSYRNRSAAPNLKSKYVVRGGVLDEYRAAATVSLAAITVLIQACAVLNLSNPDLSKLNPRKRGIL